MDEALMGLRVFLGGTLLVAAAAKILRPALFVSTVMRYQLLPRRAAIGFGYAVPWGELAAALMLLTGTYVALGGALAALLLGSFIVGGGVALARGMVLDCNCFGLLYRKKVGTATFVRDTTLLAFAIAVAALDRTPISLSTAFEAPTALASLGMFAAILAFTALALLVAFGDADAEERFPGVVEQI